MLPTAAEISPSELRAPFSPPESLCKGGHLFQIQCMLLRHTLSVEFEQKRQSSICSPTRCRPTLDKYHMHVRASTENFRASLRHLNGSVVHWIMRKWKELVAPVGRRWGMAQDALRKPGFDEPERCSMLLPSLGTKWHGSEAQILFFKVRERCPRSSRTCGAFHTEEMRAQGRGQHVPLQPHPL